MQKAPLKDQSARMLSRYRKPKRKKRELLYTHKKSSAHRNYLFLKTSLHMSCPDTKNQKAKKKRGGERELYYTPKSSGHRKCLLKTSVHVSCPDTGNQKEKKGRERVALYLQEEQRAQRLPLFKDQSAHILSRYQKPKRNRERAR